MMLHHINYDVENISCSSFNELRNMVLELLKSRFISYGMLVERDICQQEECKMRV